MPVKKNLEEFTVINRNQDAEIFSESDSDQKSIKHASIGTLIGNQKIRMLRNGSKKIVR